MWNKPLYMIGKYMGDSWGKGNTSRTCSKNKVYINIDWKFCYWVMANEVFLRSIVSEFVFFTYIRNKDFNSENCKGSLLKIMQNFFHCMQKGPWYHFKANTNIKL